MTVSRPDAMAGLCWMYSGVNHIGASAQCPPSSRSRMMCIAACLFLLRTGSLLVNSDSGSVDATTGAACAKSGAATISERRDVRRMLCVFMARILMYLSPLPEEFHHQPAAFVLADAGNHVEAMVEAGQLGAADRGNNRT